MASSTKKTIADVAKDCGHTTQHSELAINCTKHSERPAWQVTLLQEQERLQRQVIEMTDYYHSVDIRTVSKERKDDFVQHYDAVRELLNIVNNRVAKFY